jgi:hypothetical protein
MFKIIKNRLYKNGVEISTHQEFLEFVNFYLENPKFCEYGVAKEMSYKYAGYSEYLAPKTFLNNKVTTTVFHGVKSILNNLDNIDFDVIVETPNGAKPLQRPFVWTIEQKTALIVSIIREQAVPPIAVVLFEKSRKHEIYQIIDGKQRLSTIISYVQNEFPIIIGGFTLYYRDLDYFTKATLNKVGIPGDIIRSYYDEITITDKQKIEWFELINFAGTPQEIAHLNSLK